MPDVDTVHVRVNGWCDTCGGLGRQAVEHEDVTAPMIAFGGLVLTQQERIFLAVRCRAEAGRQDDFRYWNPEPVERARLRVRWRQIADALDPDGSGS